MLIMYYNYSLLTLTGAVENIFGESDVKQSIEQESEASSTYEMSNLATTVRKSLHSSLLLNF